MPRITGGIHRSRILVAPRGTGTRPTSDRVREALFSMLEARRALADAVVIDLYAGTGALGLEALSRGAASVTFVESSRRALDALARNVDALRANERARILPYDVGRAVSTLEGTNATLLLCDPPYAEVSSGAVFRVVERAVALRVVADGAWIVLEHATRDASFVRAERAGLRATTASGSAVVEQSEQRQYGDTTLTFFRVCFAR